MIEYLRMHSFLCKEGEGTGRSDEAQMKFTKMHGLGNDYVYVNCFEETVTDPAAVSRIVSDRHFGIGSDGLILIKPSPKADFEMDIYNADGSRAKMCGNGIRCVAKYVYDYGLTDQTEIRVDTQSGVKTLQLTVENGKVSAVRVNMGSPILEAAKVPFLCEKDTAIAEPIEVAGKEWLVTAVSMGNPHAVYFVDDVQSLDLEKIGPAFEFHEAFPDRVNTEFVKVLDEHTIEMRVWERGSGETLACGTGSCAAAVAAILNGCVKEHVTVRLMGGSLDIFWDRAANQVYMTGPAVTVFDGEITL